MPYKSLMVKESKYDYPRHCGPIRGPYSKILRIIDQIENEGYDSYRECPPLQEEAYLEPETPALHNLDPFPPKRRELQEIDFIEDMKEKGTLEVPTTKSIPYSLRKDKPNKKNESN